MVRAGGQEEFLNLAAGGSQIVCWCGRAGGKRVAIENSPGGVCGWGGLWVHGGRAGFGGGGFVGGGCWWGGLWVGGPWIVCYWRMHVWLWGVVCVSCWTGTAGKVGPALRSARAPPAFCLPLAAPPPSSKPPPCSLHRCPLVPRPLPLAVCPPPFVSGARALPSPGPRDAVHCCLFFPEQRMPAAVLRRVRGAQCDWHWRRLQILVV